MRRAIPGDGRDAIAQHPAGERTVNADVRLADEAGCRDLPADDTLS